MEQGKFILIKTEKNKQYALQAISQVSPNPEKPKIVKISNYEETRTDKQNRYLWGWVYSNIAKQLNESGQVITTKDGQEMEWTKDLLHEAFKLYRKLPPIETMKGVIEQHESTASMSKKRFSEFVDQIRRACLGWWNIEIPEPVGIWLEYYGEIF